MPPLQLPLSPLAVQWLRLCPRHSTRALWSQPHRIAAELGDSLGLTQTSSGRAEDAPGIGRCCAQLLDRTVRLRAPGNNVGANPSECVADVWLQQRSPRAARYPSDVHRTSCCLAQRNSCRTYSRDRVCSPSINNTCRLSRMQASAPRYPHVGTQGTHIQTRRARHTGKKFRLMIW